MDRIITYYNNIKKSYYINKDSMWDTAIIPTYCNNFISLLNTNNNDFISHTLENIAKTTYAFGYECYTSITSDDTIKDKSIIIFITLKKLLDEMNIIPIYIDGTNTLDIEALFPFIDNKIGFKVDFPEVFDYSYGYILNTSRGKISHRMLYALYYVWNISQYVENIKESSILEIGGGGGRIPYYASKLGVKKYTIVDIPTTSIIQAHYNFNIIGENNVALYGENNYNNCFLNLIPAHHFNSINEKYDLICNFDGLTEYGIDTALNYVNRSMILTNKFLSINHTLNSYNFTDLYKNNTNINVLLKEQCNYRYDIPSLYYNKEILQFNEKQNIIINPNILKETHTITPATKFKTFFFNKT